MHFEEGLRQMAGVDIVICSTAAPHTIISPKHIQDIMEKRKGRSLFLIDIAMPRDVDPAVNDIENVYLYNIDDLQQIVDENQKTRRLQRSAARPAHCPGRNARVQSLAQRSSGRPADRPQARDIMKTLRLGSRKSPLAQAQANWIAERLRSAVNDLKVDIVLITTSGDLLSEGKKPKGTGGLKAFFTKEIEEALLDNKIDLAVHSLKDMAAEMPKGLVIGAVPEREDPRDVWISSKKIPFKQIPANAKIGTGAVRRQAQLKRLLPKAELIAMRGNVDTRLRKLADGKLDGIVLALAGLKRLGRESSATESFPIKVMVPAVGQGCLGIQIRENYSEITAYLNVLDHPESHAAAKAERSFLKALGGSCQTPIAAHARIISEKLQMIGLVISPDGSRELRETISGTSQKKPISWAAHWPKICRTSGR